MAFVLEYNPDEERVGYIIPGYKKIFPKRVVSDKDKDIKLFKYWNSIDEPHEEYFAIVYENQVYKVCLMKKFIDKDTVCWRTVYKPDLPDKILQALREAMKVYGCFGNPFLPNNKNSNVIIDF